ncbi:MAG TPA: ATP-binding protein, partial [Anaerolineae bacterium]|nr:ATP-binding protein [Anaerolineae bacterium]
QDCAQAGITPELQIPDKPLYIWGDPYSVERILENLLSNAIRYGRSGGIIGVGLREGPDKIWIDVWDRGRGIPPYDLPYIFDRLYTAESSRNSALQGSGLGLAITKRLVEKQHGEIFVESTPHEKTTFSFYLNKSM